MRSSETYEKIRRLRVIRLNCSALSSFRAISRRLELLEKLGAVQHFVKSARTLHVKGAQHGTGALVKGYPATC